MTSIYLDPPFNSNQSYSAIFADESGRKSDSQIQAFNDSWHWGPTAEGHLAYLKNSALHQGNVPTGVSQFMAALEFGIGKTPMLAYLVEMAVRLVELHRVLKPTGSLYLHCDPTASHYLKVVLDAIFGAENFRERDRLEAARHRTTTRRREPSTSAACRTCSCSTRRAPGSLAAVVHGVRPRLRRTRSTAMSSQGPAAATA